MSRRLVKLGPDLVDAGLFPDQPGENAPLWVSGQNVSFIPGYARPSFGTEIVGEMTLPGSVNGMGVCRVSGAPLGFAGNKNQVVKFSDPDAIWSPTVVGTGYTGTDQDVWVFAAWSDWMIFTNNVDHVQISKAGAAAASLDTDSQFSTAKVVLEAGEFVFAFNTDQGDGNDSWWCNKGNPEVWLAAAGNIAGDIELRTSTSEITCAKLLREIPFYYTEISQHRLNFVGAPDVWQTDKTANEFGACGPHAVAEVGAFHYGFSKQGLWRSDGVQGQYIDVGLVHDFIADDINEDYLNGVVVFHADNDDSVIFSYPSASSTVNDRSVAWHLIKQVWTILGYGFTSGLPASGFSNDLIGMSTGVIQRLGLPTAAVQTAAFGYGGVNVDATLDDYGYGEGGYGGYDAGAAGLTKLETRKLNLPEMADPDNYVDEAVAHVDFLKVKVKSPTSTLVLYLGYTNSNNDTPTFTSSYSLAAGEANVYVNVPDMKYFVVRIWDTAPTSKWKLSSIEIHGDILGT